MVGRSAAYCLQPCRKCKPEEENSDSIFHINQQRSWKQCKAFKSKGADFVKDKMAERA